MIPNAMFPKRTFLISERLLLRRARIGPGKIRPTTVFPGLAIMWLVNRVF